MNTNIYYNYVLKSQKDNFLYIGFTTNLAQRIDEHDKGLVYSTKYRRPLILVYYEVSTSQDSALHREKYLKTTYGHRYLRNRIGKNPLSILL